MRGLNIRLPRTKNDSWLLPAGSATGKFLETTKMVTNQSSKFKLDLCRKYVSQNNFLIILQNWQKVF
jgi:hypothetical protein